MQQRNTSVTKSNRATLSAVAAAASAALLLSALQASAATLTYDADTTAPANDGVGVWNTTTANWFDGTNDVLWPNTTADTAIFGVGGTLANAAAGTVTVATVNAGTIQFNPTVTTGYTLTGGTITLGTGVTSTSTLTQNITSVIAGTNGLAFTGTGTATVSLNGANTYSGITTLSATGRLQGNNIAAFGATSGAAASTLGTDYTVVPTGGVAIVPVTGVYNEAFTISGSGQSFSGALRINGSPTLNSLIRLTGAATILNNGGGTLTVNGNVDTNGFAAQLQSFGGAAPSVFNGNILGTGGVSFQGSTGPLVVNGAKTYTGATTVGSATANSGILAGTATLASGTVTVAAGASITPSTAAGAAATIGTLGLVGTGVAGTGNLVLNGTYVADLTAAGSDLLSVNNALTLGAASVLTIPATSVAGLPSYTLLTYASRTGTFGTVTGVPTGYSLVYGPTAITIVAPEPATLGALAIGLTTLVRRRRRHA